MVDVQGPSSAHAILFLHGAAVTGRMWLPQVQALVGEYRLLAPDLPGHGTRSAKGFRLAAAVEEVSGLIEREAAGRALLVGSSMGGYVAVALAHRYQQQAAGLVLSGCSVSFRGLLGLYVRVAGPLVRYVVPKRWSERLMQRSFRRILPANVADAVIGAGLYPKAVGEALVELAGKDFRAMLRSFPGPVLILNGENDKPNRRAERGLVAAASRAELQIIPDASHACSLERPEAFTAAVRHFAKSIGW